MPAPFSPDGQAALGLPAASPRPQRRAPRPRSNAPVDFGRLQAAVDWSLRQLEKPRAARLEAIREYVGAHYAEGGAERAVPTNFIELAATIYCRQLAARAPRCTVTARTRSLRPFAAAFEAVLNQLPDEIGLADTLRRAVLEALFSVAVVKVGVAPGAGEGDEPFCDLVPLDRWFCDMSAQTRGQIQFEGDTYRLPLREARELYRAPWLEADPHATRDPEGRETADSVSVGSAADELEDRVELRDVYVHATGRLVTYAVTQRRVLRDVPFDGPEGSPYVLLGFSDVPGNLLPLPPAALWRDLHDLANSLFRRLARQAEARKTVAAFAGGNDDDVANLQRARDGEGLRYNGPKPELLSLGGVDQPTLAFYLQLRDLFGYFAGNLDSIGGLSPQADTATQERLLAAAGSARMAAMADRVSEFCRAIFRRLAWYLWTDPLRHRRYEKPVKGTSLVVEGEWTPETRDGDFLDYGFSIDVHSMAENSPEARVRRLAQAFQRFILPLMPAIEAQGGTVDPRRLVEFVGENIGLPELSSLIEFGEPGAAPEGAAPARRQGGPTPYVATMDHSGPREYVRRDVGKGSGPTAELAAALMNPAAKE